MIEDENYNFIEVEKIHLDENKRYIMKVGDPQEIGYDNWNIFAERFKQQLVSIGVKNVVIMPINIQTEIIEE